MKSPPTDQSRQAKALRKAERNRRYCEKKRLERVLYERPNHALSTSTSTHARKSSSSISAMRDGADNDDEQNYSKKKRSKTMEVGVTTAYKPIDSLKRTRRAEIVESLTRSYEQITKATLPNETADNRRSVGQVRHSPLSLLL